MNIKEVFRRLNRAIEECREGINNEADQGKKILYQGMIQAFGATMTMINEINHGACNDQTPLNKCIGYGVNHKICTNKVPKKFLQLYCTECNQIRNKDKNIKKVVEEETVDILRMPLD